MARKHVSLLLCSVAAVVITAWAMVANEPASQQGAEPGKLQALLKERRDTLSELVDVYEARFRRGSAPVESVIVASNELLNAELELAETNPERVTIREKLVSNLRLLEQNIKERYDHGTCPIEDLLRAKAARLKAEIDVLHEKGTTGTGAKQGRLP